MTDTVGLYHYADLHVGIRAFPKAHLSAQLATSPAPESPIDIPETMCAR